MPTWFTLAAFALLVVIPVVIALPTIPDRLGDLRAGIHGVRHVPVIWCLLIPSALLAAQLAQVVPLLEWGWLGMNIVVAPLAETGGGTGTGGGGGAGGINLIALVIVVPIILLACLCFNFYEEQAIYRDTYRGVLGWAGLHLIMGIPLFAIIPLTAAGIGYKRIYDRHGQREAYVAHVATNGSLIALLVVLVLLGG